MALDPISAALEFGSTIISTIWPNPADQAREVRLLAELAAKGDLAELNARVALLQGQMQINAKEAEHKSIFVAGWRPFVGWVGGFSLLYVSILEPIMRFIAVMVGFVGKFPVIDTSLTIQVLLGMLGIAGLRSFDKSKGTSTDSLKGKSS
jgi:hypothetical protein